MDWPALVYLVAGVIVVCCTLYDFLATVLTVSGGGPLSGKVQILAWRALIWQHRRRPRHARLAVAGPMFALCTVLCWILALWLGWLLVFLGATGSVINATSGLPATLAERAYFVGYTVTTLGIGDFIPAGGAWQLASVAASASGLLVFTMAITYIVPLVSATAQMRSTAAYMRHLGYTPDGIIDQSLRGGSIASVELHLVALTPMVDSLTQSFLAYPILHYFHSPESDTAFPVRVAVLDEALTVMTSALAEKDRLPMQVTAPLQGAIAGFLDLLDAAHISPADEAPPAASRFRQQSMLTWLEQSAFENNVAELSFRRRQLLGLVVADGWTWRNVSQRR